MKKSYIKKNMDVIGADGVHVGTVDRVIGDRIRLIAADSGQGRHKGHHHYIQLGLVADIEGDTVRLSANAANAVTFEEVSRVNAQRADPVCHAALERASASAHALH